MIERYPSSQALAEAAAETFVTLAGEAIDKHRRFTVALAGGSTPEATYRLLATPEYASRVHWPDVHVFWGDERSVPPDHPESDYRMAYESLLQHAPIPPDNIHRICAEQPPEKAAAEYERQIIGHFALADGEFPRFDLVFLGMGEDGHTVSLFPHTTALDETDHIVVANYIPRLETWRITLTAPAINAAVTILFLVTGKNKAEILRTVIRGPFQPHDLPAQMIQPVNGSLHWLVDDAAAMFLFQE